MPEPDKIEELTVEAALRTAPGEAGFHLLYFGSLAAFQLGGETHARWQAWAERALAAEARDGAAAPLADPLRLLVGEIHARYQRMAAPKPADGGGR